MQKKKKKECVVKFRPRNQREHEVNTFSPSCSVLIEFSFTAVPLAQLRNHGSCSIVTSWTGAPVTLDFISRLWGNSQRDINLIVVEFIPQSATANDGPGSPLLLRSGFADWTSVREVQSVPSAGSEEAVSLNSEICCLFVWSCHPKIQKMLGGMFRLFLYPWKA